MSLSSKTYLYFLAETLNKKSHNCDEVIAETYSQLHEFFSPIKTFPHKIEDAGYAYDGIRAYHKIQDVYLEKPGEKIIALVSEKGIYHAFDPNEDEDDIEEGDLMDEIENYEPEKFLQSSLLLKCTIFDFQSGFQLAIEPPEKSFFTPLSCTHISLNTYKRYQKQFPDILEEKAKPVSQFPSTHP